MIDQDLDSPRTTVEHGRTIRRNRFLREVYRRLYTNFCEVAGEVRGRAYLELGSGGGFLKELVPEVIASDVQVCPGIEMACRAEAIPLAGESVDALFMLNVFHHLADPERALREFSRVLVAQGRVVMVEPANTPVSRFLHRFFHHEAFDATAGWGLNADTPLSIANGAQPWLVFVRDRPEYEKKFPELEIASVRIHTPLLYVLSGGVNRRRSLAPHWTLKFWSAVERILKPLHRHIGLFMTVELVKRGPGAGQ